MRRDLAPRANHRVLLNLDEGPIFVSAPNRTTVEVDQIG